MKNSLSNKRNLIFELATKSPTSLFDQDMLRDLKLAEDVENSNLVYKTNVTVSYSRKATAGRAKYSLVEELAGEKPPRY